MIYISLDTNVWFALLTVDFHDQNNPFEELCYWIENRFLIHVVPENLLREWNRNKQHKIDEAVISYKQVFVGVLKNNTEITSTYQPDIIKEKILYRVERVENILNNLSEKATESEFIFSEAVKRNLACLAPNHLKDSFRDTINILSLLNHFQRIHDAKCYFSTLNYKDFSASSEDRFTLHSHLSADFTSCNLQYYYFGEKQNFGKKLFGDLRKLFPSFMDYLKEIRKIEQEKLITEKQSIPDNYIDNTDKDFIENVRYIDLILSKPDPTLFELEMIKTLTKRHKSYEQYFLKNVGKDGLV